MMGVMKEGLSAWPETVAYKRMLRNLIRGQEYVPPQQPTIAAPTPEAEETPSLSDRDSQVSDTTPATSSGQVGGWQLLQNLRGDLVARHGSGAEIVLAANPEGKDHG